MAGTRADETAADAPGRGTPGRDEAAKKGAEGIQDIKQYDEEDQQMKTPDGPDAPTEQEGGAPEKAAGTTTATKTEASEPAAATTPAPRTADTSTEELRKDAPAEDHARPADGAADAVPPEQTHTDEADEELEGIEPEAAPKERTFVGEGAGAVVAAALGVVSLTGSWAGTVAGARQSLVGQLQTSQGASVSKQIQAVYGDQWHAIALVSGAFALLGLIVGVVVLATPAFGKPGEAQPTWIKSVSWAGVVLGVVGLLLAVLKYSDAILGLPSVSS